MIEVVGPDGTIHEFPAGTADAEIDRNLRRYYGATDGQRRAAAEAAVYAAGKRGKRSLLERWGDVARDTWETSWLAEGYRAGFKQAADGIASGRAPTQELNPAKLVGRLAGTNQAIFDQLRLGDRKGSDRVKSMAERMVATEAERRGEFRAVSAEDPFWKARGGLGMKVAHGGASLAGFLTGAAADPVSWVTAGRSVVTRAATTGTLAAGSDVLAQEAALGLGLEEEYSLLRTGFSALAGAGFSAVIDLPRLGPKKWVEEFFSSPETRARDELEVAEELHAPAMSEAELPTLALPAPERVAAPEAPRVTPEEPRPAAGAEAPKADPEGKPKVDPEGEPKAGPEGKPQGDEWSSVDWGSVRSSARAEAAMRHLEKLRKLIKPGMVQAFVRKLDEGVDPAREGAHINPEYVDWDHLDANPEDLLAWAGARADIFRDAYEAAGDRYRSWDQTHATSRLFGSSLSDVVKVHADVMGEGGLAARLGALREAALESDRAFVATLREVEEQVARGDYSGVGKLAQGVQRTVLMDAMAAGASSEVARSLNYMQRLARPRAVRNDLQALMEDLADVLNGGKPLSPDDLGAAIKRMRGAYEDGGSPKLRDELRKMRTMGVADYLGYLVTGNLLSAPKTHLRNLVGTPLHALFSIAERYVAAGIGAVRQATGLGSKERVTFREALAYSTAMGDALQDALRMGVQAFIRGTAVTDGGSSVLPDSGLRAAPFALSADRMRRWRDGGFRLSTALDVGLVGLFEMVRTFGYRPSVAADEFYKVLARRMEVNALAYREAHYRSQLADPAERERVFTSTLAAVQTAPTDAALRAARSHFAGRTGAEPGGVFDPGSEGEEMALILRSIDHEAMAVDHARLLTFQKVGPVVQQFDRALRMVPLVKYLYVNFLRTPMALLKAGMVDRNPALFWLAKDNREPLVDLARMLADQTKAVERGGAAADLAIARLMTGSAVISWAWGMWAAGDLVGRRGDDHDTTRLDGVLPYSVRLPDGSWLQYSPASPLGEPLGLVADFAQAMRERELDDAHGDALMGALVAAVGNNITNKTFLAGLGDLMDVLEGPGFGGGSDRARGKQVASGLASTLAARVVPLSSLLRSVAQDQDPVVRDVRTLLERIQAAVPGWSNSLPAKRDFLGRPLVRPAGQRGAFQAFSTSNQSGDPLEQELSRLAKALPDFRIEKPDRRFNGAEITPEEHSRLLEVHGQLFVHPHTGMNLEETLRNMVASEDYASWGDREREYRLKKAITTFRTLANRAVRDPRSDLYMAETVRRTAAERLRKEVAQKRLSPAAARSRARFYGYAPEDPDLDALEDALFPGE